MQGARWATLSYGLSAARWRALAERGRHAGLDPTSVLVGALIEVLQVWSATAEFTVDFRLVGTDQPVARAIATTRSGGRFADRVKELQRRAGRDTRPAGSTVTVTSVVGGHAPDPADHVRLDCRYTQVGGTLDVGWRYRSDTFPAGVAEDAFATYTRLLERLADDETTWRSAAFNLVPVAHSDLVARVNDTAAEIPDVLLHELVFERARQTPDAEAVVDARRRLSYGELLTYANRIGHALRDGGVRPGELVAIVMDKGWEQYAAVYGVLAAGGAYLPIDATVPARRLAHLLDRGKVRHVLTQSTVDTRLDWPDGPTRHLVDTDFETGLETGDRAPLGRTQSPTDLAYVIFTSGSTGEPKGVMVDHRGVVNLVADVNTRFGVGPTDRAFAVSGLHFDASIYDVFGVLAAGGTVVLPEPYERAEPDRWADLVRAERVTLWNSVPVLMEVVVDAAEHGTTTNGTTTNGTTTNGATTNGTTTNGTDRPLSTLRLAVLSGDWIPLTLPDRLRAQAEAIQLVASGGPTETICWSVFYPVTAVDHEWASIPYGKPIANQRYRIVDANLRQRPLWVPGQMAVSSDVGLAQGYWDDAERTAAQFVTLPDSGERAYLTGDIGRHLPDGNIEILGRDDFQVKISGYRIELGEIEAALRAQPGVKSAVVVAPTSDDGVRRLHGYVVGGGNEPDADADPDALRDRLAATLPAYMVPAVISVLDDLPLTRNGKVDRLALTEQASRPSRVEASADSSDQTPLERIVAAAIAEVLGLDQVERTDNFFRLGGDSLSGTRFAGRLRDLLGVDLALRTVFNHPVVADLASAIASDPEFGPTAVAAAEKLDALVEAELAKA